VIVQLRTSADNPKPKLADPLSARRTHRMPRAGRISPDSPVKHAARCFDVRVAGHRGDTSEPPAIPVAPNRPRDGRSATVIHVAVRGDQRGIGVGSYLRVLPAESYTFRENTDFKRQGAELE